MSRFNGFLRWASSILVVCALAFTLGGCEGSDGTAGAAGAAGPAGPITAVPVTVIRPNTTNSRMPVLSH